MLHRTKGIVIKTFTYNEADVIVRVFSRDNGKLDMIAKGAKKMKSRLSSSVQPFTIGDYTYYQKNNNLAVLQQSEVISYYKNIISDLKLTFTGYYICEFIDYFLPENYEHSKVFDLTAKTLELIDKNPDQCPPLFLAYKIKAISLLGFTPQLNGCVKCGLNPKSSNFIFSVKEGGLVCSSCLPENTRFLEKKEILLLLFLLKSTYEEILKVNISISDLQTAENIISKFIQYHCEGRVFRSEGFLKNLT